MKEARGAELSMQTRPNKMDNFREMCQKHRIRVRTIIKDGKQAYRIERRYWFWWFPVMTRNGAAIAIEDAKLLAQALEDKNKVVWP